MAQTRFQETSAASTQTCQTFPYSKFLLFENMSKVKKVKINHQEIRTGDRRLTSLGECAEAFVTILQIFSPFLYETFKQRAFHLQLKKYTLKANIHIV